MSQTDSNRELINRDLETLFIKARTDPIPTYTLGDAFVEFSDFQLSKPKIAIANRAETPNLIFLRMRIQKGTYRVSENNKCPNQSYYVVNKFCSTARFLGLGYRSTKYQFQDGILRFQLSLVSHSYQYAPKIYGIHNVADQYLELSKKYLRKS